jgi:hypothetical protein
LREVLVKHRLSTRLVLHELCQILHADGVGRITTAASRIFNMG